MKGTIYFMLLVILVGAFSLPVALGIYWITSSLFTILQNMLVERKKARVMNKYYYEGKTKEQAEELALEELKVSKEDLIINSTEEKK